MQVQLIPKSLFLRKKQKPKDIFHFRRCTSNTVIDDKAPKIWEKIKIPHHWLWLFYSDGQLINPMVWARRRALHSLLQSTLPVVRSQTSQIYLFRASENISDKIWRPESRKFRSIVELVLWFFLVKFHRFVIFVSKLCKWTRKNRANCSFVFSFSWNCWSSSLRNTRNTKDKCTSQRHSKLFQNSWPFDSRPRISSSHY